MKNRNLLLLSMLVLMAGFFFGCSKDTPVTGKETTPAAIKDNSDVINNASRLAPRHHGSIIGVLVPVPAKASIIAFNDQYVSEETICNQDGSFKLDNLVPGGYRIRISYVPVGASDYSSFTVQKVLVIAGNTTNLGNINLD